MGDVTLKCPLCCNKTFTSRESLIEHLGSTIANLYCPICTSKWSSVLQLIEHLSHGNCLEAQTLHLQSTQLRTIVLEESHHDNTLHLKDSNILEFKNVAISTGLPVQNIEGTEDVTHMYEELMKPTHQTELQFMKDGDSQYVILTQEHDGTVVTKQNNDGTISLTSVKDMKLESESEILPSKPESEESEEGMYSCNTCAVSFSSVIEHIQNYHNDQDVVVEEPMDETEGEPIEFMPVEAEVPAEKQTSRRVITDTGNIVETPLKTVVAHGDKEQPEKVAGSGSKRYRRMNNICDSVIRNLKQNEKSGPTHKVVVKEVLTKDGEMIKYYHCVFCNTNVSSLSDFKSQPCKGSKYACLQCPVIYDNAKSLCAHMKVHKVKTPEIDTSLTETFECEICNTVFTTNKSLKLHKRMHDPIKSRQIEAPKNSDYGETYLCTTCDKMMPVDYRDIHEKSHLNEQNLLNCGICNKKFSSEEYLEMHMNVHNLEKAPMSKQDQSLPYTCVYCDRTFARPHEKVKHERIHTGEKPHACEICGKSFRVSYCLTLHMRTHTGARPYGCPHCGKRFKAHSVYNHHLLTHSEVRAYKCPYCPKAFKTSVQLAGHKNSHTKPFSCTHCNRPFASLYAVRVHTETHGRQNNLKFSCSLCGASYARAFALKDHIKQQHKGDVKSEFATVEEWVGEAEGTTDVEIKSLQSLEKDITLDQSLSGELILPN